jgi:hypothetical protein
MIGEIKSMRDKLNQAKGKRKLLQNQLEALIQVKESNEQYYNDCLKAREIAQEVATHTQVHIEFHISNLVTMALASVFPDPYDFRLQFVQRRNKTEADLIFSKGDNETDDILNSGGGGVSDVASMALRIALWSIKKTRSTFILDEPFKFLHNPVYQEKASEMIKEISKRLGIQIIMVSDQENIINAADKVVDIYNVDGESRISNE